ncbi:MAG TPA: amidohydrolase family protein, partial [Longimicrobiaceae bacterium]|nr:amidohydrolase family protein [Longimicrobiaceae bacterium]
MTALLPPARIDVHAHLAGVGTGGSGCWSSPALSKRLAFRVLRWMHGVTAEQLATSFDADWAATLAERVRGSELQHAVALGFDGVYDARGELDPALSQMVVPPAWVFAACRAHPELLPGPSVNPHRRDALERLEECIEGGAVLLKWLPATQGIDPSASDVDPFYRRMADTGLPLLVHSGGSENTFAQVDARLKDLRLLERPLRAGVTVIVAHTA